MYQILATDYGNMAAFMLAGPVLLLCWVVGVPAWFCRAHTLTATCGIACIGAGVAFLLSFSEAKSGDRVLTISIATVAVATGLPLMLTKRKKSG